MQNTEDTHLWSYTVGYETADGQNGRPRSVGVSNPRYLYLCASVGQADSAKELGLLIPVRVVSVPGGKSLAH